MINITRDQKIPESLQKKEIRDYLAAIENYKDNPEKYSKPKKPVSYRNSDVLEAFDRCFYAKCYLTEQKFISSYKLDIDHFIPQNEAPELIYEWSNLYPAEHTANMSKPRKTPQGGYMDPCNPDDDVEKEILYSLSSYGESPQFKASDPSNTKCCNTVELLNKLHNGTDKESEKRTVDLRHAIHKKYIKILNKIIEWQKFTLNSQEKFQAERELKDLLSRKSSYTMLCRSMPAVRVLPEEYFD